MTTTDHFRTQPETYSSAELAKHHARHAVTTNPRYIYYKQTHFTAGDEEQFDTYRDKRDLSLSFSSSLSILPFIDPRFCDLTELSVRNTFRYIFHKFKKGIFVQIREGRVNVMLPFSKYKYTNDWSQRVHPNHDRFSDWNALFAFVCKKEGRTFNPKRYNRFREYWYANNALIRCEHPIQEHDTGVAVISHLFQTLCAHYDVPDIELFINRRDYPLLTRDGTESYTAFYDGPLQSHVYSSYAPILSMCTTDRHADVLLPTTDDWTRVCHAKGLYFPNGKANSIVSSVEWTNKVPVAVFRGSSTGYEITVDTNPRLKVAWMSLQRPDLLDAGITKWNARPRKCPGSSVIDTFPDEVFQLPLVPYLSLQEQSMYKYIVHIDGHVAAFRLSSELSTGSVLLKVESPYKLWFSDWLVPYTHYIPIKADLSDLFSQIEWCRSHDKECAQIAENAYTFYTTHLTETGILKYLHAVVCELKSRAAPYSYSESYFSAQPRIERETAYLTRSSFLHRTSTPTLPDYPRSYDLFHGLQLYLSFLLKPLSLFEFVKELHCTAKSRVDQYRFAGQLVLCKTLIDEHEGIHEAFVGQTCVNEMYHYLPHFAYTLGWIEGVLVTEYIESETMFDWLKSDRFNMRDYTCILHQLALALYEMQQLCSFTHYDVCPWNILLTRVATPRTIQYPVSGLEVTTRLIPILIDYGKSHVIVEGHHYGFLSVYASSTIHDILSLLLSSLFCIVQYHHLSLPDLQEVFRLSRFFSGTRYTNGKQFEHVTDLKRFLIHAKKFATLIDSPKYELETRTPLDFVRFLGQETTHFSTLRLSMRFGSAHHVLLHLLYPDDARERYIEETNTYWPNLTPFQIVYVATFLNHSCTTLSITLPYPLPDLTWPLPSFTEWTVPEYPPLTDEGLERPHHLQHIYASLPSHVDQSIPRYHLLAFYKLTGTPYPWNDTVHRQTYIAHRNLMCRKSWYV